MHATLVHDPVTAVQLHGLALGGGDVFLRHKGRALALTVGGVQALEICHAHGLGRYGELFQASLLLKRIFYCEQIRKGFIGFEIILLCVVQSGNTSLVVWHCRGRHPRRPAGIEFFFQIFQIFRIGLFQRIPGSIGVVSRTRRGQVMDFL